MRIISGSYRGKQIRPPAGCKARPTTDFAKEGLFNILNNFIDFETSTVLDLFSGTGSIAYEFASRGALRVTAVEIDPLHQRFIRQTAEQLEFYQLQAIRADAMKFIRKPFESYDIIFADPPYDMKGIEELPGLIFNSGILDREGIFILEHSSKKNFSDFMYFFRLRQYGNVNFSFFSYEEQERA